MIGAAHPSNSGEEIAEAGETAVPAHGRVRIGLPQTRGLSDEYPGRKRPPEPDYTVPVGELRRQPKRPAPTVVLSPLDGDAVEV